MYQMPRNSPPDAPMGATYPSTANQTPNSFSPFLPGACPAQQWARSQCFSFWSVFGFVGNYLPAGPLWHFVVSPFPGQLSEDRKLTTLIMT